MFSGNIMPSLNFVAVLTMSVAKFFMLAATGAGVVALHACSAPSGERKSRSDNLLPIGMPGTFGGGGAGARHIRESNLQAQWRGRSYGQLVSTFGVPPMSMEIPGRRDDVTFAVFYGVRDGGTRCVDAFTIVIDPHSRQQMVADYFCR